MDRVNNLNLGGLKNDNPDSVTKIVPDSGDAQNTKTVEQKPILDPRKVEEYYKGLLDPESPISKALIEAVRDALKIIRESYGIDPFEKELGTPEQILAEVVRRIIMNEVKI